MRASDRGSGDGVDRRRRRDRVEYASHVKLEFGYPVKRGEQCQLTCGLPDVGADDHQSMAGHGNRAVGVRAVVTDRRDLGRARGPDAAPARASPDEGRTHPIQEGLARRLSVHDGQRQDAKIVVADGVGHHGRAVAQAHQRGGQRGQAAEAEVGECDRPHVCGLPPAPGLLLDVLSQVAGPEAEGGILGELAAADGNQAVRCPGPVDAVDGEPSRVEVGGREDDAVHGQVALAQ